MRRAAIAQLGSTDIDQVAWAIYVSEQIIRRVIPLSLRHAASFHANKEHKAKLRAAALRCEKEGTSDAASDAARAASYAARYAASDAASYAASYAAKKEGRLRDKILSTAAEICVEACIKCKTQGSKWLDIVA